MEKYPGIIYAAFCIVTKKYYIGQTIHGVNKRKISHYSRAFNTNSKTYNNKFYNAIRKYGKHNFKWFVIYPNIQMNKLSELEIKTIEKYNSYKKGYNSTLGGEATYGFKPTKETRKKMSDLRRGSKNPFFGKSHTKESKKKISLTHLGKPSHNKGKKASKASRKKMSENHADFSGEKHPRAKLTLDQVKEIREHYNAGQKQSILAKKYNVSKYVIFDIVHFRSWKII